jgi:hypothetical protein
VSSSVMSTQWSDKHNASWFVQYLVLFLWNWEPRTHLLTGAVLFCHFMGRASYFHYNIIITRHTLCTYSMQDKVMLGSFSKTKRVPWFTENFITIHSFFWVQLCDQSNKNQHTARAFQSSDIGRIPLLVRITLRLAFHSRRQTVHFIISLYPSG